MNRTIWKFPLELTDRQTIEAPVGLSPLTVQYQLNALVLWATVAPSDRMERRRVAIVGTGNSMGEVDAAWIYCGTAQEPVRPLVWHVFMEPWHEGFRTP